MAITLLCPNLKCRTVLQVPDKARGRKVRCARCGRNFMVPANPGDKKTVVSNPETAQPAPQK